MKEKRMQFLLSIIVCCLCLIGCAKQSAWQKNLESMKEGNMLQAFEGDLSQLKLTDYTYKGKMKSEKEKKWVIEAMFLDEAPITYVTSDVLMSDTTFTTTDSIIKQKRIPTFEILTVGRMLKMGKLTEAAISTMKQQLDKNVEIGTDYLELVWDYKGKEYRSIAIVYNGEFPDDLITAGLFTGNCTITKGIKK